MDKTNKLVYTKWQGIYPIVFAPSIEEESYSNIKGGNRKTFGCFENGRKPGLQRQTYVQTLCTCGWIPAEGSRSKLRGILTRQRQIEKVSVATIAQGDCSEGGPNPYGGFWRVKRPITPSSCGLLELRCAPGLPHPLQSGGRWLR